MIEVAATEEFLRGPALQGVEDGTLLFDELEKAHPLILDLFLQILNEASITLASGEILTAETALFASGRQSNVEGLGLEALGVNLGARGLILETVAELDGQRPLRHEAEFRDLALVGGLGSVEGALLGGMAVGVAEALAGALLSPSLREVGGYAVVLLVLTLRPHGLLGQNQ